MKIPKNKLEIIIKEELTTILKEEDMFDKYIGKANKICREMKDRDLFLRILNKIIDNPGDYEEIIEADYPEYSEWLIDKIDDAAPWGWTKMVWAASDNHKANAKRRLPSYIKC